MSEETELIKNLLSGVDDTTKSRLLLKAFERANKKVPTAFADARLAVVELEKRYKLFTKPAELRTGQLVKWKAGLKNKRRPETGEPAIVVEILDSPVYDQEKNAGTSYFREPLDIVLGVFDEDEDFNLFYFDSRRFEPFEIKSDTDGT